MPNGTGRSFARSIRSAVDCQLATAATSQFSPSLPSRPVSSRWFGFVRLPSSHRFGGRCSLRRFACALHCSCCLLLVMCRRLRVILSLIGSVRQCSSEVDLISCAAPGRVQRHRLDSTGRRLQLGRSVGRVGTKRISHQSIGGAGPTRGRDAWARRPARSARLRFETALVLALVIQFARKPCASAVSSRLESVVGSLSCC